MLEKFDFVPKKYAPFGSTHTYVKPDRVDTFPIKAWKGLHPYSPGDYDKDLEIQRYYRQKLQDQMNIVERKRRLTHEAVSGANAPLVPHEAATDDSFGCETDGENSEEADIFERKARFERLHAKYTKLRKEKGLLLKGNDLRSNIYLKKMEKLARNDLGLDIVGYKDYVNNLKRFAAYN